MGIFFKKTPSHAALLVLPLSLSLSLGFGLEQPARCEVSPFRLLELERDLQKTPADPNDSRDRRRLFALAESRFDSRLSSAAELFRALDRPKLRDSADWLMLVYRVKMGVSGEDARELKRRLRNAFSERKFFAVFDDRRTWRWRSPLGHQFEFREFVDRLEIDRDGASFFTLELV